MVAWGKSAKDRGVQAFVVASEDQGGPGRGLDGERLLLEFKKAVSRAGHMRELRHRRTFENSVDEKKRRARGRSLRRKAEERQRKMFQDSWKRDPPSHIPVQERAFGLSDMARFSPPPERGSGSGPSWGPGPEEAAHELALSGTRASRAEAAAHGGGEASGADGSARVSAAALAALEEKERLAIAKAKRNTSGQRRGTNTPRRASNGESQ